jgi:rSAM/selenodomain-associated transferase 1
MAKAPVAGRVKTRLAREIGAGAAAGFARHAIASTVARVRSGPWQTLLAVAPDVSRVAPVWPHGVQVVAQGPGDLGARMQRITDQAALGPVVIIGTDIPSVRAAHIRQAFHLLGRHDAVVGAATDGGYWLIGARRRPRVLRMFAQVRWSSRHALSDTLRNLAGRSVARIATLADIDAAEDMAANRCVIGRRILPCGQ